MREMLPLEFGAEKKIKEMIVAGAFNHKLKTLVTEEEFDREILRFLNEKSTN